ncbi:MAG: acyl-CoA thioesterase [Bacteroidetes bacterium]|nr:acyl-CoA thioesterase [Bacteroidota bacterium]
MTKTPSSTYKIRFNDCDMFGHLNNARYIDYLINARQDHLKENYGFDFAEYYKNNLGWVINSHEITYLKPAFFDEIVSIQSCLLKVDNGSLLVEALMMDENKHHLKAIMRSKLILVNIKTGKKEVHTPEFMNWAMSLVVDPSDIPSDYQDRIKQLVSELRERKHA